ncbi:MAG: sigma 54-interacting transcriptional regulator [Candidatus Krumholzibacteria bacterium]|nr:sigma 54-interacting transcriptional regulator [Candidatus Krumholzibacteria bacterium]
MRNKKTEHEPKNHLKAAKSDEFFAEARSDLRELEASAPVRAGENAAREFEKMTHRIGKLELLTDITKALNSTLDLDEVLEKIIDSTIQLADANRGFLMLADDRGVLEFRVARDSEKRALRMEEFAISFSIVNDAADRGEPLFISDLLDDNRFKDQKSVIDLQLKRAVCVPLLLEQSVIGVIYADSDRLSPALAKDDMSIITAFASQATIAVENAKLHGKVVHSQEALERENLKLRQELTGKYELSGFIGRSRSMQEIFLTIQKIASYTTTVLIQGETGTGKELIARAIHSNGLRKDKPLVTINCGAMPKDLLESELFGHKKGSFTGAVSDKPGLFEAASGGSIFLDEIGEMPLPLQVKLLRVLQEGEVRRVGENTDRKVDVRVIAATNRDLSDDVKKGLFRGDLYYRLNVVPITIPPLRERQEDIIPLVEHFLRKFGSKMNKTGVEISSEAMKFLLTNPWPGNVRELENSIERALALSGTSRLLAPTHFPQLARKKYKITTP